MKEFLKNIPILHTIASKAYVKILNKKFSSSQAYWMKRYAKGGNSGAGSCGRHAEFKAEVLNTLVSRENIKTIIEYGCGDGNQLRLARYENYLGFEVSPEAIRKCNTIFHNDTTKKFKLMEDYAGEEAEATLSLDVVYHMIEDDVFEAYMKRLFSSAQRFVVIYSTNTDIQETLQAPHIKHRKFTTWVEANIQQWRPWQHIPHSLKNKDGSDKVASFYIYKRRVDDH